MRKDTAGTPAGTHRLREELEFNIGKAESVYGLPR